jgi:hypothetical protein
MVFPVKTKHMKMSDILFFFKTLRIKSFCGVSPFAAPLFFANVRYIPDSGTGVAFISDGLFRAK